MKRILRPERTVTEKAEYICDFTGKKLTNGAPVRIEIWCGYGSNRDGVTYRLHLCDEALNELMTYLRLRMFPRPIRRSGSHYLDGLRGRRVAAGPEDSMMMRKLRAAVQKQVG